MNVAIRNLPVYYKGGFSEDQSIADTLKKTRRESNPFIKQ